MSTEPTETPQAAPAAPMPTVIELSFMQSTLIAIREAKDARPDQPPFDGVLLSPRGYVLADWVYALIETDVPRLIKSIENPVGRNTSESELSTLLEGASKVNALDVWLAGVKLAGAAEVGSVRVPLAVMKVVRRIPRLVDAARAGLPVHNDTASATVKINPDNAAAVVQEVAAQAIERLPGGLGRALGKAVRPAPRKGR